MICAPDRCQVGVRLKDIYLNQFLLIPCNISLVLIFPPKFLDTFYLIFLFKFDKQKQHQLNAFRFLLVGTILVFE